MALINYVSAAAAVGPTVSFQTYTNVYNYDTLVWRGTPILESVLEAKWLLIEKQRIMRIISASMLTELTGGFTSDALEDGVFRRHTSDTQAQLSMMGAHQITMPHDLIETPETFVLPSYDITTGQIRFDAYTHDQLHKLLIDFGTFSSGLVSKLQAKIAFIQSINSGDAHADLDVVYAVTWNSVE